MSSYNIGHVGWYIDNKGKWRRVKVVNIITRFGGDCYDLRDVNTGGLYVNLFEPILHQERFNGTQG